MAKRKTKKATIDKTANIAYSGSVSVSVRSGGKTLSKKTYHNAGGTALFLYLCNCLRDGGGEASSLFPNKVKLFNVDQNKYQTPDDVAKELGKSANYGPSVEWADISDLGIESASVFVAESDSGNVDSSGNRITLSFRVPYAYIASKDNRVNMIGLYGRGVSKTGYWSAYYLFEKDGAWDALTINKSQNYNLLIEWTMAFDNVKK